MRPSTALLTPLLALLSLATTTGATPLPPSIPQGSTDIYPGGSLFLLSDTPGQRATSFRQPVDINKVTILDLPMSAMATITEIKFNYFLNVDESKVQCHAYLDEEGLKPFGMPFTKFRTLDAMYNGEVIVVRSVLCIVVV
jgi:hypothetical protein